MNKLNQKGIGHLLALAVLVLGFSTYGTFQLVSSNRSSLSSVTTAEQARAKCKGTPTLSRGKTGVCVKYIQFVVGVTNKDGVFGPMTRDAVKAYQERNGLKNDGVVGTCTWKFIQNKTVDQKCKAAKVVAKSEVAPKPIGPPTTQRPALIYCTYPNGPQGFVSTTRMTSEKCKDKNGTASTTNPNQVKPVAKITCSYKTKAGVAKSKTFSSEKKCADFKKNNHYGYCSRVNISSSGPTTKKKCDSFKDSSAGGGGTWREF